MKRQVRRVLRKVRDINGNSSPITVAKVRLVTRCTVQTASIDPRLIRLRRRHGTQLIKTQWVTLQKAVAQTPRARVLELLTDASNRFDYQSHPMMGHSLHGQDPSGVHPDPDRVGSHTAGALTTLFAAGLGPSRQGCWLARCGGIDEFR